LILLVWAVIVVHPVDNVLRPYLIGERVKLSTLYVFFALIGGLAVCVLWVRFFSDEIVTA